MGSGCRVWAQDLGFGVWVQDLGFRFGVLGFGTWVQGLGVRVQVLGRVRNPMEKYRGKLHGNSRAPSRDIKGLGWWRTN